MATVKVIERHPHPKYQRLSVQLRSDSKFYQAVTYLDGKLRQVSTKTPQLVTALKLAEDWYRRQLRASVSTGRRHPIDKLTTEPTMAELFISYKAELPQTKRPYADMKWSTIADFWRTVRVTDVSPQTFKEFYKWRRRHKTKKDEAIKNHTVHKDVILIRQVLKYAIQEGHLQTLPIIPTVGKIEPNPRPWLTETEYNHLIEVSMQRIIDAEHNPRVLQQRQELYDQIIFMFSTMIRVGEMLALRYRDCRVETNTRGDKILFCEVQGKRGMRTVVGTTQAASVFKQRSKEADDPNALVFPTHHREAFTELLKAAGLHVDPRTKFERNFKSLRATAISYRILSSDQPNLLMIARNAGTSVQMIDQFYAQRLSSEMGKDALTARRKPKTER